MYKFPLRDVVDLKSQGCRKLPRESTGVASSPVLYVTQKSATSVMFEEINMYSAKRL